MTPLPAHLHIDPSTDYRKAVARVAAQLHPDLALSKMSLVVMNKIVNLVFDRIATLAAQFARDNKRNTVTSREIQMAVRHVFAKEGSNMATH
jgi:histone H2B